MRIISVRLAPVAKIFAVIYAVFGLYAFLSYAFTSVKFFTLPIGIILGIFHWNININLARSTDLIPNALLCLGAILSYALSGAISGIALALCFNLIAPRAGGIDAKCVVTATAEDASTNLPTSPPPLHT